jgi:MFS superfamily sulfate permease-like transporter
MLIVRLDAPLFFANANVARTQILNLVATTDPPPKALLFDMSASNTLDITSIDTLESLINDLETLKVKVLLCHVLGPVRDKLRISGLMKCVGEDHVYPSVDRAVQDFLGSYPTEDRSS